MYAEMTTEADVRAGFGSAALVSSFQFSRFPVYALSLGATSITSYTVYTRRLNVTDNQPPQLTLRGPPEVFVPLYGSYKELGAAAYDLLDGTINDDLVIINVRESWVAAMCRGGFVAAGVVCWRRSCVSPLCGVWWLGLVLSGSTQCS